MAFTPEQEATLTAIMNAVTGAGFTTEQQFQQAMTHLKLQNELNKLTSEYANLADEQAAWNSTQNASLEAKQAEINAKNEEIKDFIEGLS